MAAKNKTENEAEFKLGLYCFDLDGTLISGYMDNPEKEYHVWEVLPGRLETLQKIHDAGGKVALVTNQGGVAYGHCKEVDFATKLQRVLEEFQVGGVCLINHVSFCIYHEQGKFPYNHVEEAKRRKPSGTMIREAMECLPEDAARYCCMVGDRPEDEAAAKDAGVDFYWASNFFPESEPVVAPEKALEASDEVAEVSDEVAA